MVAVLRRARRTTRLCHLPREEISRVYKNFLEACPNDDKCPGLEPRIENR